MKSYSIQIAIASMLPALALAQSTPTNNNVNSNTNQIQNQIQIQIQLPESFQSDPFLGSAPQHFPRIENPYEDLLRSCSDATMELKTEQNLATFEAMEGNFEGASRNLRNALVNARQKLIDRVSRPLPYTLKALSGSVYVEEESRQALNQIPERYKETRDMVSYLVLDQLTNLSLSAYRDLDHPYYVDYARRSSDWELDSSRSIAYFDGIRRLAVRFLSFQDKIKDALATDGVELRTARASAVVAIRLLEHSPFRRGFCPSIRDLESLVRLIDRFDGPDQRIPRDQQRRLVRSWIASILDRLNQLSHQSSCDSYRPFPSNP